MSIGKYTVEVRVTEAKTVYHFVEVEASCPKTAKNKAMRVVKNTPGDPRITGIFCETDRYTAADVSCGCTNKAPESYNGQRCPFCQRLYAKPVNQIGRES